MNLGKKFPRILGHAFLIMTTVLNVIATGASIATGAAVILGRGDLPTVSALALAAIAMWIPGIITAMVILRKKVEDAHECFHGFLEVGTAAAQAMALAHDPFSKGGPPTATKH